MEDTYVLLCTRDAAVAELVEVVAAAQEVEVRLAGDLEEAGHQWAGARLRLVSTEVASRWDSIAPGPAHLIGADAQHLARCSAQLGVPVLPLPDAEGRLAQLLAGARGGTGGGASVVAMVGASGGLGVSTLAVALALSAARQGVAAAVVDLASYGGGLDLLLGMEASDGARWADLAGARGALGDIGPGLPSVGGVPVVTQDRARPSTPSREAVAAVLDALSREHRLVVADCSPGTVPADADQVLLMVGADVRSVASGRMLAESRGLTPSGLVVRRGNGRALPTDVVGRALGAPVAGTIGNDRSLPGLAELGLPPLGGPARRFTRQVSAMVRELVA